MLKKNKALMVLMALLFLAPGGVAPLKQKKRRLTCKKGINWLRKSVSAAMTLRLILRLVVRPEMSGMLWWM